MISSWFRVNPKSNDSCPYKKKGRGRFDKDTEGDDLCEYGDRLDVSTSQGVSRIGRSQQKLGERHGMDSSSELSEGINLANIWISDIWLPEL